LWTELELAARGSGTRIARRVRRWCGVRVLQAAKAVNESRVDGRGRKQENEKIFHLSFDISHLSFIARHEGLASMFVWPFDSKPHLDAVLKF
jgi:hypothetical protein